jgi:hypothetical protein
VKRLIDWLRPVGREPLAVAWGLAAALVAATYYGRFASINAAAPPPADALILTANEVRQLGGGTYPRWSVLQEAYGLSDSQIERSACLTEGAAACGKNLTGEGEAVAMPKNGRLIVSLSDH